MWQLFIVTFLDWWGNPIWSSLIHFGQIWSKKIRNKTAIFILFKNVSTLYTNILWYMQPLKSSQTQTDRRRQTQKDGNTHRHRSSNSSLDIQYKGFIQCGLSMMSWVDPYSFIESIHTLNKKIWIDSNLTVWLDSIKGYQLTQDVIDGPHCTIVLLQSPILSLKSVVSELRGKAFF